MITFENECVGCPPELGCMGNACKNRNVPRFYCDECEDEVNEDELYEFEGEQLCIDCIEKRLPKVDIESYCYRIEEDRYEYE